MRTVDDRMSNTLRKGETSRRVAEAMGCSNGDGGKALKAVIESVTDAMRAEDRIVLMGFGTFERKDVKARRMRPVRGAGSGKMIEVPAHTRVRFRAGRGSSLTILSLTTMLSPWLFPIARIPTAVC